MWNLLVLRHPVTDLLDCWFWTAGLLQLNLLEVLMDLDCCNWLERYSLGGCTGLLELGCWRWPAWPF